MARFILGAVVGCVGIAGMTLIEAARGRFVRTDRIWDRTRVCLIIGVAGGALLFGSGFLVGLVYLPNVQAALAPVHIAARLLLAVGIGLFLLWTAQRIHPTGARILGWSALLLGIGSAVGSALIATLLSICGCIGGILPLVADPWFLALSIGTIILGIGSLLLWLVEYAGVSRFQQERSQATRLPEGPNALV